MASLPFNLIIPDNVIGESGVNFAINEKYHSCTLCNDTYYGFSYPALMN
ncbi:hypothetical protein GA0061070_102564 [Kosakonia oryziphila]|uniref:Uncharacterized protein n=1 Tax=Kosakonia oryziphila TaxID=1005667 RepID=A0A1C4EPW5_9ENTR|nr:hypothetical protein GA0061070_102564 [Kosakonia oryziphila]